MFNVWTCLFFVTAMCSVSAQAAESVCYGTTSNGHLKHGVKLPTSGENFVQYSRLAALMGRTYVHSDVRAIMLDAYKALETELPTARYKYAETGFAKGGEFSPHKTHRNGLSVDFMTPMKDKNGMSVHLPTNPLNRFGYDIDLGTDGSFKELRIDYDALAAHLVALHRAAKKRGYDLWRVIFDPTLQAGLFNTSYGDYLKGNITLLKTASWVRHDEHYHVDFAIPCEELPPR